MAIVSQSIEALNSLQLLGAYQKAVDENIISSITDLNGIIVHANQKFCDISKYPCNEIIGQNHRLINSGYHSREFFTKMWNTILSGNVWHNEIKNRAKDGSTYWVDTVIVPIKSDDNIVTHFLSLRTLISERKLFEEKKAQYVSSLETLMVMTSIGVKKPLSSCMNQIKDFDSENRTDIKGLRGIVDNLKLSVTELDNFTKELTNFIREMKI